MNENTDAAYEKKAREQITALLIKDPSKGALDVGLATAQLIAGAARACKDPHLAIVGVTRGAMLAVHLSAQEMPTAAVEILKALANLSLVTRAGPEQVMTWVVEGIAEAAPVAGMPARNAIREKIEAEFVGIGLVFDPLSEKAFKKASTPPESRS